jgi:hypothetical protein
MAEKQDKRTGRSWSRTVVWGAVVLGCSLLVAGVVLFRGRWPGGNAEAATSRLSLEDIPFNGARAYRYLEQICAIGRRPSGSPGMERQQEMLIEHFRKLGGEVRLQRFRGPHPIDQSPVPMANLIVEWHPDRKERILLCAHYDTLPYPVKDPVDPRGVFVGANDGASGVAVLMELAHEIPTLSVNYGIDFVLFDAEEFVFDDRRHRYFLGSEYFARQYVDKPPPHRYRWGVLLDMIGDKDLQVYHERNSVFWRDTRPLVDDIWATARRLGVREFIPRWKYEIRDDHLMLRNVARIPTCDIIDYDYPPWHTQGDTPDKCSALSLAKVGWVVREWLKTVEIDVNRR